MDEVEIAVYEALAAQPTPETKQVNKSPVFHDSPRRAKSAKAKWWMDTGWFGWWVFSLGIGPIQ